MARSRRKMIKTLGDSPPPESDVGKVELHTSNKPTKRSAKAHPLEKPSAPEIDGHGAIENLNVASTGELIQRLEKELKVNGPHTETARRLKAALGKAFDAEPSGMKSKEELELIMRAAASRWPIMPAGRRKVIQVIEEALADKDPNVRMRAVANVSRLDRMNQLDEKKSREEQPPYDSPTEPIREAGAKRLSASELSTAELPAAEQRRLRLSAITQRLGFDGVVIDVAGNPPGDGPSATTEPSHANGTGNGHAGGVCSTSEPGQVDAGQTPGVPQPSGNGHYSNGRQAHG